MIRLFWLEVRRCCLRRLFRVTTALSLLTVLVTLGVLAARSSTDLASARAHAASTDQQQYDNCVAMVRGANPLPGSSLQACRADRVAARYQACVARTAAELVQQDCAVIKNAYFNDPRFHFADEAHLMLTSAAYVALSATLLLSASGIGAEWQAGTFGSLLTWQPRRQRVLAAKLAALVFATTALWAVTAVLLLGGAALVAGTRGTMTGTTPELQRHLAAMTGRVAVLSVLLALIGAGVATIARNTAGALGLVGGYCIVEAVSALSSTWWQNHGLAEQSRALVEGAFQYTQSVRTAQGELDLQQQLSAGGAAAVFAGIAVVVVTVACVTLSRRDVT